MVILFVYRVWKTIQKRNLNKERYDEKEYILGLRRIENGYFPNNEKSRKMQIKLGYKDEGIRRKKFLCLATNEYVDECVTGLLKEEFIEWSDEDDNR